MNQFYAMSNAQRPEDMDAVLRWLYWLAAQSRRDAARLEMIAETLVSIQPNDPNDPRSRGQERL